MALGQYRPLRSPPEGAVATDDSGLRAQQPGGDVVDVYTGSGTRGLDPKARDVMKQLSGIEAPNIAGDAEVSAMSCVDQQGWTKPAGAVSRPSCPFCTTAIMDSGGEFTGPLGPYRSRASRR